jgi:hypothetical protein
MEMKSDGLRADNKVNSSKITKKRKPGVADNKAPKKDKKRDPRTVGIPNVSVLEIEYMDAEVMGAADFKFLLEQKILPLLCDNEFEGHCRGSKRRNPRGVVEKHVEKMIALWLFLYVRGEPPSVNHRWETMPFSVAKSTTRPHTYCA